MFRNQYDQDVLTWSPQGRLHQIECASKLKSILFVLLSPYQMLWKL
jgi:hypothetical protein